MAHFVKYILHQPLVMDIRAVVDLVHEAIQHHTEVQDTKYDSNWGYASIYFDYQEDEGQRSMMVSTDLDSDHCDCEPPLPGKKVVISLGAGQYGKSNRSGEDWVRTIGEHIREAVGGTPYFIDDYSNQGNPIAL